ncbi:MAG: shikimate dehydrogenase [Actinomycetota bacterium]|nr:shikimate dehydrogenase [Actinomycetota bacterium]
MSRSPRFAVLGSPIAHSRSPAIHAEAMRLAGIDGTYEAIEADEDVLNRMIRMLRSGEIQGLNVTMPLKEPAARFSDTLTEEADSAGSANTLRYRDGSIEGHNTDLVAFQSIFHSAAFRDLENVLILGSGGSARAALSVASGGNTYLSARSAVKAAALAEMFDCQVVPWVVPVGGSLVVNATPLGMKGESLPAGILEAAQGLIDLPYGSGTTPAVEAMRSLGLPVIDGYEFLARQAAEAFLWWTGVVIALAPLVAAARNG